MSHLQLGKLAEDALDMALLQHRPDPGLTLHHDQGSQYRSLHYRAKVAKAKIRLSMSRPGMPYDNAMIESFFANLKLEINDGRPFVVGRPPEQRSLSTSKSSTTGPGCIPGWVIRRPYKPNSNINRSGLSPDYPVHETRATST